MRRLLVFTRYPRAGEAKTRLIPALGPEGAAKLQRELTERTLAYARLARARDTSLEIEVRTTGADTDEVAELYGRDLSYVDQGAGDLGERLAQAFDDAFEAGAGAAAVIGTDCPELDESLLSSAFEQIAPGAAVIGPAKDGGYYLLGLAQPARVLFESVDWGTSSVFEQTAAGLERLGLERVDLVALEDIDRPDDLERWLARQPRTGF